MHEIGEMSTAETNFARGKEALARGQGLEALRLFELASAADPGNAEYQSYVALLNALERGRIREAVDLAAAAAARAPDVPSVYVNLTRIHIKAGDKESAVQVLREGLRRHGDDPDMLTLMHQVGVRKPPIFESLPRSHFLNKYLGKLAAKLGLR